MLPVLRPVRYLVQQFTGHHPLVPRYVPVAEDHSLLAALAGQEHDVALLRPLEGVGDGLPPVWNTHEVGPFTASGLSQAGGDGLDDRVRILRARVFVRHHNEVRQASGGAPHAVPPAGGPPGTLVRASGVEAKSTTTVKGCPASMSSMRPGTPARPSSPAFTCSSETPTERPAAAGGRAVDT